MAYDVSPQAPNIMDPASVGLMQTRAMNSSQDAADMSAFVGAQTRLGYLSSMAQVGTREAMAMQETRVSAQSREILQSQAALAAPRDTVGPAK